MKINLRFGGGKHMVANFVMKHKFMHLREEYLNTFRTEIILFFSLGMAAINI